MKISLTVNGAPRDAETPDPCESLLTLLRERLDLPGSKGACEQGECGSCSVYLDGVLVCACLVAAGQAEGCRVVTVEGLAPEGGSTRCRRRSSRPARSSAASARRAS